MGCDGGTIPKRDELVKVKKKPETKDKTAELAFQWRCCVVSQEALQSPIVTCGLGRLYNKSAVIEGLLNRTLLPTSAKHIRSLKDIKDLNLTPNPEYKLTATTQEMLDSRAAPFICPVTRLEMSGKFRFICLWNCGCVMSERALKEIATKICHKCQKPFVPTDIIILNGNEDDVELMKQNMEMRKIKKKSKKNLVETSASATPPPPITTETPTTIIIKEEIPSTSNNGTSSPIPTNKIKRSGESANGALDDPEIKKMKTDYSVAKDPKVTDVYKSLFTTHQSEKDQTRAHWVTYNPFYN